MGAMPTSRMERPKATYEDLLKVPDHKVAEIVDGELYVSPRPAAPHALAATVLSNELGPPFHHGHGGPGGWWIVFEPELHLREDILVPDLAGWKRERMPEFPKSAFFTLPPDWICEVLSPSTERLDRARKLHVYAREGIAHAWLITRRPGPSRPIGGSKNAGCCSRRSRATPWSGPSPSTPSNWTCCPSGARRGRPEGPPQAPSTRPSTRPCFTANSAACVRSSTPSLSSTALT